MRCDFRETAAENSNFVVYLYANLGSSIAPSIEHFVLYRTLVQFSVRVLKVRQNWSDIALSQIFV